MVVFISGSYDILNAGHVRSFAWLKELYPNYRLVVGLNTDRLMAEHKVGQPIIPYDQRKEILEGLRDVSEVVPCDEPTHRQLVERHKVDVYATVWEWIDRQHEAIKWTIDNGGEMIITPYFPTDGVTMSCSMIRERCAEVVFSPQREIDGMGYHEWHKAYQKAREELRAF